MSLNSLHPALATSVEAHGRPRCPTHSLLLDDDGRCVRCANEFTRTDERRVLHALGAVAAVLVALLVGIKAYRIASAPAAASSAHVASGPVRIVVFGANWCGSCKAAKAWLAREGYAFEWHDVDDPATGRLLQAEANISPGRVSIPVIGVDGDYSQGFNAHALKQRILRAEERHATKSAVPDVEP